MFHICQKLKRGFVSAVIPGSFSVKLDLIILVSYLPAQVHTRSYSWSGSLFNYTIHLFNTALSLPEPP